MSTKKKVIQGGVDVQKSDGTSALTVDGTTGAANIGIANVANAVNGGARIGSSVATQSTANLMTAREVVLAAGATTSVTGVGFIIAFDNSAGTLSGIWTIGGAGATVALIGGAGGPSATDAGTGYALYFTSGNTYTLKNRSGASKNTQLIFIGSSSL